MSLATHGSKLRWRRSIAPDDDLAGEGEHADAPRRERKHPAGPVPLRVVAEEWTRIGIAGFGGPAAHIAMLRRLVIDRYERTDARALEDANGARGMSPALASTQLASSAPIVLPGRAPRSSAASDSRFPLP